MKYYNLWEPPPNPATRMQYFEKDLMPKIEFDVIKFSLELRGIPIREATKYELFQELHADINLEKKLLGERAHKAIRELETQVIGLLKKKKVKLADNIRKKIEEMWKPLREVQAETRAEEKSKQLAAEQKEHSKIEGDYANYRERIYHNREEFLPIYTSRGNSLKIDLSGITPRGPIMITPRGYQSATEIAAGSSHACLIHKSGQLYSWGVGAAGRLGLDLTEGGDPQADAVAPRVVQALYGKPVVRVACGFNSTGCIISGGELYMWGSAATGKCGLGTITKGEECYVSIPTRVIVGVEDRRVRNLSCGHAHTAVISEAGQLYVFGCGDGGRLGLGIGRYDTIYQPLLVESLTHEKVASVSCGSVTTVVCTEINYEMSGTDDTKFRALGGGRVYVAGSRNVLGKPCDVYTLMTEMGDLPVKQVAAGFQHTVLLTADGEVYCWGRNNSVCCGSNPKVQFIDSPTLINCLYQRPLNIATGKKSRQSSTYSGRDSHYAVNGVKDGYGLKMCTSTQQDAQPWWDLDLGSFATIDEIRIWNRTDAPQDRSQPRNLFSSRLFPFWVMVGNEPFPNYAGQMSLRSGLKQAVARARFTEDIRVSTWRVPSGTVGRHIRIQIEGYNFLSLAEIEVFGYIGQEKGVGRVASIAAGRDVTVAVVHPCSDPRDIESSYKRAVLADSANADILRQFETYALEYDKFGRGEVLERAACCICKGDDPCEVCVLKTRYGHEIDTIPLGIGGRRRRLNSIDHFLVELVKPELEVKVVPKKIRPTKGEVKKQVWYERFKRWFGTKSKKVAIDLNPDEDVEEEDPAQIIANFKLKKELLERTMSNQKESGQGAAKIDIKPTSTVPIPEQEKDVYGRIPMGSVPKSMQNVLDKTNEIRNQQKALEEKKNAEKKRKEKTSL